MPGEFELNLALASPLEIGATGLAGLHQALRVIVSTAGFSVPLDREFAHLGDFIDAPLPHVVARYLAALTAAIEKYEPRVTITHISLTETEPQLNDLMEGRLFPTVRFKLKDGVTL